MRVYAALVMPITMPVPREYASKFDKTNPSTYDKNVVFTGPYQVKNNSKGKLTGWEPGKQISVVRNPNWDAKTDFRPAYLDSWKIAEGNTDAASRASGSCRAASWSRATAPRRPRSSSRPSSSTRAS